MADSSVNGGTGTGAPIRVLTNLGSGNADQQVVTLGDSAGNLLGTNSAPVPVSTRGMSITGQTINVAAGTPVTGTALDVSAAGNITFIVKNTVAGTPFTGTVATFFEQSDDAVSWAPLQVVRSDNAQVTNSITFSGISANASIMLDASLEGVNWVRVRTTTAPTANGVTFVLQPGGGAFSPNVSIANTPSVNVGTMSALVAGAAAIGTVGVTSLPALVAGTAAIGSVTTQPISPTAAGSMFNSAATTNATLVKASAASLYGLAISNAGAAAAFLKLYNLAAAPTVGTSVPALVIPIPASSVVTPNFGTQGLRFNTGLSFAITNLVADSDTTAVAVNQVKTIIAFI